MVHFVELQRKRCSSTGRKVSSWEVDCWRERKRIRKRCCRGCLESLETLLSKVYALATQRGCVIAGDASFLGYGIWFCHAIGLLLWSSWYNILSFFPLKNIETHPEVPHKCVNSQNSTLFSSNVKGPFVLHICDEHIPRKPKGISNILNDTFPFLSSQVLMSENLNPKLKWISRCPNRLAGCRYLPRCETSRLYSMKRRRSNFAAAKYHHNRIPRWAHPQVS